MLQTVLIRLAQTQPFRRQPAKDVDVFFGSAQNKAEQAKALHETDDAPQPSPPPNHRHDPGRNRAGALRPCCRDFALSQRRLKHVRRCERVPLQLGLFRRAFRGQSRQKGKRFDNLVGAPAGLLCTIHKLHERRLERFNAFLPTLRSVARWRVDRPHRLTLVVLEDYADGASRFTRKEVQRQLK